MLPSILERRGAIVTISSINARVATGSPVGYAEAKAALTQFSRRLSEELAPRGARVNTVSPGVVASPLWTDPNGFGGKVAGALGVSHDDLLTSIPGQIGIASGRITRPEEVADLVTFLLSARAANIHGTDYVIDGGTLKAADKPRTGRAAARTACPAAAEMALTDDGEHNGAEGQPERREPRPGRLPVA